MKQQSSGIGRLAGPSAITRNTDSTLLRPGCSARFACRSGMPWPRWPGTVWAPCSRPHLTTQASKEMGGTVSPHLGKHKCPRWTGALTPAWLDR
eukprot:1053978-Amphidinium_carterae.1